MNTGTGLVNVAGKLQSVRAQRNDLLDGGQVRRLVAEPWLIDSITLSEGRAAVRGWALQNPDAPEAQAASSRFLVNDAPPIEVRYPLARPDVQKVLWRRADATQSGYELVANASYPNGVMKITCRDGTGAGSTELVRSGPCAAQGPARS